MSGPPIVVGIAPWGSGATHAPDEWVASLVARAEIADRLGFHSVWIPENHFDPPGIFSAPLLVLAAIAARTRGIRLGTTSYLLPIRHPLRVAEDVAVLDQLSGGRVILGVGRGFRRDLFDAFGVQRKEKRDLFQAGLAEILRAWSGEPIAHDARGEPVRLTPGPAQRPHPPIWVAAFGPKALRQAGRLGLPYLASPVEPLDRLKENYAAHREALPEGVAPDALAVPVMRTVFVTRDRSLAREVREKLLDQALAAAQRLGREIAGDGTDVSNWALVGEPAEVTDGMERYREEIGMTHLIARLQVPAADPDAIESSLHALRELA